MNEFDVIRKYFAPLAKSFPGSLNLTDDAAIVDIPTGYELIVTKDAISEGIHFIGTEDPSLIARKLLRTNLSDLASMGAAPLCYFLAIALPKNTQENYLARFAEGLAEDQKRFGIHLAGGDTITTLGTPTFSITAHGLVPKGTALKRSGAQVGDVIYVSGTLGDAALGLEVVRTGTITGHLAERYLLPEPRLQLGEELRGVATSCIDISDGLLADMGHVCDASHVGAEIDLESLPVSSEARAMLAASPKLSPLIYCGGDDYELLFTAPENISVPSATRIGRIVKGNGVTLLKDGKKFDVSATGYTHF